MKTSINYENLPRLISKFGSAALEARQVSRRVNTLLPSRLLELKREHCRSNGAMRAERLAMADVRYEAFINETVEVAFQATRERIQYETHALLYRARQSINAFIRDTGKSI